MSRERRSQVSSRSWSRTKRATSVTHGELTAGMLLGLPLGNLVAYSPIGAVEAVEIDGEPYTAVTIAPDDPEDLEVWRCMKVGIGGEELPALDAGAIATE